MIRIPTPETIGDLMRQRPAAPETLKEMLRRLRYYDTLLRETAQRLAGIDRAHTNANTPGTVLYYAEHYRQLLRYKILQLHAIINR